MLCPKCGKSTGKDKVSLCDECLSNDEQRWEDELQQIDFTSVELVEAQREPEEVTLDGPERSGFWVRFSALCIDYVIVATVSRLIWVTTKIEFFEYELFRIIAVGVLYYIILEGSPLKASIGKRIMGLIVLNNFHEAIGFGRSVLRNLAKCFLFFGYPVALIPPYMSALHDSLTGTKVVVANKRPLWFALLGVMLLIGWETYVTLSLGTSRLSKELYLVHTLKTNVVTHKTDVAEIIEKPKTTPYYVKFGEEKTAIFDLLATLIKEDEEPKLRFLFFTESLSDVQKNVLAEKSRLEEKDLYEELKLPSPVFLIDLVFTEKAKTCNEFAYESIRLRLLDKSVSADLDFPNWLYFQQETSLSCTHWPGTYAKGTLKLDKVLKFQDKMLRLKEELPVKLNLTLKTQIR